MGATGFFLGGLQLTQAYTQSQMIRAESDYQASMLDISAGFSDLNAQDAINRGKKDAQAVKRRAKQILGSQRVALAGQGIDISSGSALDVQLDTADAAEIDALQVKNNAWKEAWGHRVESFNLRNQSRLTKQSGNYQANSTLLSGGINTISNMYMMRNRSR